MNKRVPMLALSAMVLLFVVMSLASCDSGDDTDDGTTSSVAVDDTPELPAWMQQLVASIEAEPVWNPPARVYSYEYHGNKVYFVPADCCDKLSSLYDEAGDVICSPDGGIGGAGDGRCPDFFDERSEQKVVWEDSRN